MKLFDSVREIPITDLEGLRIGNAQDYEAMTGVTVLLFDHGAKAGIDIRIKVSKAGIGRWPAAPVIHYRHVNQTEGLFLTSVMEEAGENYEAVIPGKYVTEDWDLMVYITVQKKDGICSMYPGIYNSVYPYPYHVITVNK